MRGLHRDAEGAGAIEHHWITLHSQETVRCALASPYVNTAIHSDPSPYTRIAQHDITSPQPYHSKARHLAHHSKARHRVLPCPRIFSPIMCTQPSSMATTQHTIYIHSLTSTQHIVYSHSLTLFTGILLHPLYSFSYIIYSHSGTSVRLTPRLRCHILVPSSHDYMQGGVSGM